MSKANNIKTRTKPASALLLLLAVLEKEGDYDNELWGIDITLPSWDELLGQIERVVKRDGGMSVKKQIAYEREERYYEITDKLTWEQLEELEKLSKKDGE